MLTLESSQTNWKTGKSVKARPNSLSSSAKLLLKISISLQILGGQVNSELDRVVLDERARTQLADGDERVPAISGDVRVLKYVIFDSADNITSSSIRTQKSHLVRRHNTPAVWVDAAIQKDGQVLHFILDTRIDIQIPGDACVWRIGETQISSKGSRIGKDNCKFIDFGDQMISTHLHK